MIEGTRARQLTDLIDQLNIFECGHDFNASAAAGLLGEIALLLPGENSHPVMQKLEKYLEQSTPERLQSIWSFAQEMKSHDQDVIKNAALKFMLRHRIFCQSLLDVDLIKFGAHPFWYREVLITLLRKTLFRKNLADPFNNPLQPFSFIALAGAGPEENHLYLANFIKQAGECPIDLIVSLGQTNINIARWILKDLLTTKWYFAAAVTLMDWHPDLRVECAKEWQAYFEVLNLNEESQPELEKLLAQLKTRYPEFVAVKSDIRVKHNFNPGQLAPLELSQPRNDPKRLSALFGAALKWFNAQSAPVVAAMKESPQVQEAAVFFTSGATVATLALKFGPPACSVAMACAGSAAAVPIGTILAIPALAVAAGHVSLWVLRRNKRPTEPAPILRETQAPVPVKQSLPLSQTLGVDSPGLTQQWEISRAKAKERETKSEIFPIETYYPVNNGPVNPAFDLKPVRD